VVQAGRSSCLTFWELEVQVCTTISHLVYSSKTLVSSGGFTFMTSSKCSYFPSSSPSHWVAKLQHEFFWAGTQTFQSIT
jgi:hypothetical protein